MHKYRMTFMDPSLTGKLNVEICNWKLYIVKATTKTMKHSESLLQKKSWAGAWGPTPHHLEASYM